MEDYKDRYRALTQVRLDETYYRLNSYLLNNNRREDSKVVDKLLVSLINISDNSKAFSFIKKFSRELTMEEYLILHDVAYSYINDVCQKDMKYLYKAKELIFTSDNRYVIQLDYLLASFIISVLNNSRFNQAKIGERTIRDLDLKHKIDFLYRDKQYQEIIMNYTEKLKDVETRFEGNLFNFARLTFMYNLDKEDFDRINLGNEDYIDLFYQGYVLDEMITMEEGFFTALRTRRYLVPSNGVELFNLNSESLTNIWVKEKLINDDLWILTYYKYNEVVYPFFINLNKNYSLVIHDSYNEVINYLLKFYNVKFAHDDRGFDFVTTNLKNFNGNGFYKLDWIKYNPDIEYKFEVKGINKKREYDSHDSGVRLSNSLKVDKRIELSSFSRKLAEGQKASDEAKEYAKKHCFTLEEGETIVKPHEKTIKVNYFNNLVNNQ